MINKIYLSVVNNVFIANNLIKLVTCQSGCIYNDVITVSNYHILVIEIVINTTLLYC